MPPNHQKRIEDADLWDILDWDEVSALAATAPDDPRDDNGAQVMATIAKMLIAAGVQPDSREDEAILLRFASHCIGYGNPAVRRQKAASMALRFGATPERLIDYLAFKKGLFPRTKGP